MQTFINGHEISVETLASPHITNPADPRYLNYHIKLNGHQVAIAKSAQEFWQIHDNLVTKCS